MNNYTTNQGETWDIIAYRLWGSEYLYPLLLKANYKHRHVLFFDAGVTLNVPENVDTSIYNDRPPWLDNVEDVGNGSENE